MTRTVDVREAESRLRDLISLASAGDEVIIEESGKALARLVPAAPAPPSRVAGLNRGAIWTSDDFDAPLPDDFWMGDR